MQRPAARGRREVPAAEDGFITALRFYKQANNTGTHVGHLWSGAGAACSPPIPFTNETASGWQSVELPNPVAVTEGHHLHRLVLLARRLLPVRPGLLQRPARQRPLTALAAGDGGNGVYQLRRQRLPRRRRSTATNYWVDATFDRTVPPDTRGPVVTETSRRRPPPATSTATPTVSASFDEQLAPASVTAQTFTLRDADGAARARRRELRRPDAHGEARARTPRSPTRRTYTATLKGGAGGITDAAGNPLAADKTWSFTVAGQSPTEGPGGPILVITDPSDEFGTYYAEILRSEGLNAFAVADAPVTAAKLDRQDRPSSSPSARHRRRGDARSRPGSRAAAT